MKRFATLFIFFGLMIGLTSLAFGLNYASFTDTEVTNLGERVHLMTGDTLAGIYRTNDCFAIFPNEIMGSLIMMGCDSGSGGLGVPPVYGAPYLRLPRSVEWIRDAATQAGTFINTGDTLQVWARLSDHHMRIWNSRLGEPIDSSSFVDWALADSAVIFVNGSVNIWGTVNSILIFGASGRIGLVDNVLYASSDPETGAPTRGHHEKLAVFSEDEIKVMNTVANGRANSSGAGRNQTDQQFTDINLNGLFFALGRSFTFDQQNDADSGYVCPCQPDDRGTLRVYGGISQRQRGYTHRSNRGSTGYLRYQVPDPELEFWNIGIFDAPENLVDPTSIDLGDEAPGIATYASFTIQNEFVPIKVDSLRLNPPFTLVPSPDSAAWNHYVQVNLIRSGIGSWHDTLRFYVAVYDRWFAIPVSGSCSVPATDVGSLPILHPSSFGLSASPNPFNPSTTIQFELPAAGDVTLAVYDLLGRNAATLVNGHVESGTHSVMWDAANEPTGIYFVRLESACGVKVQKLLLAK